MATQNKGEALKIKGMVLYMNRNTKTTKGYYYVNAIKNDKDGRPQENEKGTQLKWAIIKSFQLKKLKMKNKKKSKTLSSLFNMATLKICRSTKTAIYHTIQRCRVIQQNIN